MRTKDEYLRDLARRSYNTFKGHKTAINAFEEHYTNCQMKLNEQPLRVLTVLLNG